MFRHMHAFVEGYRALKVLEEFNNNGPTYMPRRFESGNFTFSAIVTF